jgi:polyadenylate-binding protein
MLYEVFNSVGPVGSIRVCRDSVTRRSLGYGYVNFHSVKDAERALDTLNYSNIKGRSCRIMWSQRDPSLRKSGAGNVFVRNLDPNIDNKALYDTFSLFGNILSCKVASDASGKSRGYGFVHFETEDAAKQAIERVNGMQIGEKTVEVMTFVKCDDKEKADSFTNVYVKNFPVEWDEAQLKEEFGKFGTVASLIVMTDDKGRKAGFINYESNEMAKEAIAQMHEKDLRTDEQKKEAEGKEPETGADGHPDHLVYAAKAQSKAERAREYRQKFASEGGKGGAQGVNLFVKNLDDASTDDSLKELFEPFGTITSAVATKDDKGNCKGFGFVCYATPDEATKAVTEMHLKVVKGKPLYVGLAEKREARQERLRQRYTAGPKGGKGGFKGGKGGGKFGGGPQMGGSKGMDMQGMGMPQQMGGPGGMPGMMPQMKGMPNMMMGQMGKGMPQMGGKGMMPGMMMAGGKPGMPGMPGMPMGMMGPMGPMMRPQMPMGQPGQMRPPAQQQPMPGPNAPLTAASLAAAPPGVQKQMLGEKVFPLISKYQPELAGKITGMMLEMDNSELLILLESEQAMKNKVDEAMRVLSNK